MIRTSNHCDYLILKPPTIIKGLLSSISCHSLRYTSHSALEGGPSPSPNFCWFPGALNLLPSPSLLLLVPTPVDDSLSLLHRIPDMCSGSSLLPDPLTGGCPAKLVSGWCQPFRVFPACLSALLITLWSFAGRRPWENVQPSWPTAPGSPHSKHS